MILSILEPIRRYLEIITEAKKTLDNVKKKNGELYNSQSTALAEANSKAEESYKAIYDEAYNNYIGGVIAQLNQAHEEMKTAFMKPIPDDIQAILDNYKKIGRKKVTEEEVEILTNLTEHNALARRMVESEFNVPEEVVFMYRTTRSILTKFKNVIRNSITTAHDVYRLPDMNNYELRVLLHEETTKNKVDYVNDYLKRFSDEA